MIFLYFVREIIIDDQGFPTYKRWEDGLYVLKNSEELDNWYVVPYNIDLLVKYQGQNCLLSISSKLISLLPFFPN